jgi:predicted nuclease of predicted toxin-antitoxin system
VKFLVDHQLPVALAEFLRSRGHDSQHVSELGLKNDDDLTIWKHATSNNFVLISKDQDLFNFASRPNEQGKLVWVRLGNCRNQPLLRAFEEFLPRVLQSFDEGNRIIEIR